MRRIGEVAEWPNAPVLKAGVGDGETSLNTALAQSADKCLPLCLPEGGTMDEELVRLASAWASLPDHLKQAILTLLDAAEPCRDC